MQGPEVFGEAGRLLDAGHLLIDVCALVPSAPREDIGTVGAGVARQEIAIS
jgi:hypothetical protein